MRNSTAIHDIKPIKHNVFGYPGVRIVGSQPFSTCIDAVGTSASLTNDTLATIVNLNGVYLSPDTLNGPIAGQAQFYQHFAFREVIFEYITVLSSGAAGSLCMSYTTDSNIVGSPTSYTDVRQVQPSVTFAKRTMRTIMSMEYSGGELWWNKVDAGSEAGYRQTVQGLFLIYPDEVGAVARTNGYINIHYILDLFGPTATHNLLALNVNGAERKLVTSYLKTLRMSEKGNKDGYTLVDHHL
jgi:hypothetical protein